MSAGTTASRPLGGLPPTGGDALVVTGSVLKPTGELPLRAVSPVHALGGLPNAAALLVDTRDTAGQTALYLRHLAASNFDGIVVLMTPFVHVPLCMGDERNLASAPEAARRTRIAEWALSTLVPLYVEQSGRPFSLPFFPPLVGMSQPIETVRTMLGRVVEHDRANVLIRGSSGTGKQVIARGIHDLGPRAHKPFVEVNCTSLPDTLLESELFGREKGAYTDAHTTRQGLIETAGDGTIFLDEIGHVTEKLQMALLKVIEQRTFRRVGGTEERTTNARFIAATSRNLEEAIQSGAFRGDLYYRLNVFTLALPELHERDVDALLLAYHYAREYATDYGHPVAGLTGRAALLLLEHAWPGNVRELKNIVERAVVFHDTQWIGESALILEGRPPTRNIPESPDPAALRVDPSGAIRVTVPPWGLSLEAVERAVIEAALQSTHYNITKTAKLLFISRDTLRYRMKKFGLRLPQV